MSDLRAAVEALAEAVRRPEVQEKARKAIEDELIEWRDEGRSMPFRNNGLVVKFHDGTPSDIIRFGPERAVVIGVTAIADHLAAAVAAHPERALEPEGVGTGAGEDAPRQDTGSAWVTRSEDCPEAPAQAHPLPAQPDADLAAIREHAPKVAEAIDGEWMQPEHGCDGSGEEACMAIPCPVPAFMRMGLDELRDAAVAGVLPLLAAREQAARADELRSAAADWRTSEPQRSTYAHAMFFARELDLRADRIEAEDDGGWHCAHEWLDRPESDTRECLICGVER